MNLDTYTVSHWNEATRAHELSILTIEQNFTFDALGFVVLPQVLSVAELSACRHSSTSSDGLGDLCSEGGTVGRYVRELCGDGFRQDGHARHVSAGAAGEHDASLPLDGGVDTLERAYITLSGWNGCNADGASLSRAGGAWEEVRIRQCQGLLVVIALTDSAGDTCPLVVVPSSHKSGLPAPPLPSSSPFVERPALAAGDVLLCAASTLHGVCPQGAGGELLVVNFISRSARPQVPPDQGEDKPSLPEWSEGLGEAEQTVLAGGDSRRVLLSDGTATWLSPADDADLAQRASSALEFERRDDAAERWAFDTHGFLLVEGVMEDDWVDAAMAGIDANLDRVECRGAGNKPGSDVTLGDIPGAPTISGTGRPELKDLFQLPAPHNAPFLKMLAHPAIIQRLNWMIGAGYRVTQNTALCHVKGSSGQMLHSGNANPTCIGKHYEMVNGRVHTRTGINVAWQLNDVGPDDGGFVVVPGTHKSRYPLPHSVRTCNERTPIRHVPMGRGSVLFFLGGTVCHGAYRWEAESPRRTALFTYGHDARRPFAWPSSKL